MKKLALFDLDGTLFNTENVNYEAYNEALKEVGKDIDYEYYCKYCNGRKYTEFLPKIIDDETIVKNVHKRKKELYSKYLDKAIINKELFSIIRLIQKEYYCVVVTTASRKNTEEILNYFKVQDLFDRIITQEDIICPKPDPEGFLKAMNLYNIDSQDTIIFEDSDVGVIAAKKTGATVFKIVQF